MGLKTDKIKLHREGMIGWLIFNNPSRHNAMSLEMWQGLGDGLLEYGKDPDVRVVILTGQGDTSFISGADISEFESKRNSSLQKTSYDETMGRANQLLSTFKKPLISLIRGYCIGGGLATALHTDIRFATPKSRFGIPASKLGIGYGVAGLAKLATVVGSANARDIIFSARLVDSEEAKNMGLINFVVAEDRILQDTINYALTIANNAPLTIAAAKATIDSWETLLPSQKASEIEVLIDACFDSEDYQEGLAAFADKRKPVFLGK